MADVARCFSPRRIPRERRLKHCARVYGQRKLTPASSMLGDARCFGSAPFCGRGADWIASDRRASQFLGMGFPTTRWSLLAQATIHGGARQAEALAEFYRRYHQPVADFIRRRGADRAQAEDLTQGFFVHLIESSTLQRADPSRGRFRAFPRGALPSFLARDRTRLEAGKRGGGEVPLSIESLTPGAGEPTVPAGVAEAFDREWARDLLARARHGLATEWRGEPEALAVLMHFLPGAVETPPYAQAAETLGWTLARLKTEVFRLRQQFRERVRAEVALTVDAPHEIEAEMAHLHRVLADDSA